MTYIKPLGKFEHSRAKHVKPVVSRTLVNPADYGPPTEGSCDGYEAGRLLATWGPAAVDAICERVAKEGGRS